MRGGSLSTIWRSWIIIGLLVTSLTACSDLGRELGGGIVSEIPATPSPVETVAGPTNTGVPAGVTLEPSGSLMISEEGAVVQGLDIRGCVIIAADDVTLKQSRVRCEDPDAKRAITTSGEVSGTVIEDVEVDGGGVVDIGVDVSRSRLSRLNVHSVNDGVRMGSSILLEDSWVHDLARSGSLHPDAVQGISSNDVVIRGNTLDPRDTGGSDLGNAAIMLGSESAPYTSRNVVIEDNLLDGGNYSLNIRGDIDAEDFVIRDNTFGDGSRYGPIISPESVPIGTGNTTARTGLIVKIDRP